jgi:holo-ACP synthase/triphosphoribosyl-dephospho-CoA synthase
MMTSAKLRGKRRAVSLEEVLEARDRRVERQEHMIASHRTPLLSITLNIPGNVKRTPLSTIYFHDKLKRLKTRLRAIGAEIEAEIVTSSPVGDEALLAVSRLSAISLKSLAMAMEEHTIAGRLLDVDVIDEEGELVKRVSIGATPRRCLLCDRPASLCGRSRAHSLKELTGKVTLMLEQAVQSMLLDEVVSMASKASSFELMVSMKPGLVTYTDSGSHTDMDRFTFAKSQASLLTYYRDCFLLGWDTVDDDKHILSLRLNGMEAEQRMFRATGGINTHRGWIYLAGILSAATGVIVSSMLRGNEPAQSANGVSTQNSRLSQGVSCSRLYEEDGTPTQDRSVETAAFLSDIAASIAHALEESLESTIFEHISQNIVNHQDEVLETIERPSSRTRLTGIRREANNGFPSIFRVGLPILIRSSQQGEDENIAGQRVIFALLATAEDTTLKKRGGLSAVKTVRSYVLSALTLESVEEDEALIRSALALSDKALQAHLRALSKYFLDHHLSCGGVADLLAGSYFARDLCTLIGEIRDVF